MIIVIPCYREAERLPQFLPGLAAALKGLNCQVQVVDDGSPVEDREAVRALVKTVSEQFPALVLPLLALPANQGKGGAIRAGWLAHREAEQLAFVDADGAIGPDEVARFVRLALRDPAKAYLASRVKMLGRTITRSSTRHFTGRIFATVVSLKLDLPVYDSQCGLKAIPAGAFFDHAERFQENGFAVDPELLLILSKLGVPMEEIPVDWTHIEGSKVHLVRDAVSMFLALNRIVDRNSSWTTSNKIK
jgi:dolichyl-phosphate beta-glucosyltransferase